MRLALLLAALAVLGGMAYIRLAPSDPARWHRITSTVGDRSGAVSGRDPVQMVAGSAHAAVTLAGIAPGAALARLDAVALATPRTTRLAGSPEEGSITWVTRSAIFGFPDYTTAVAHQDGPDTILTLHARQRFGRRDFGVNAARLRDWIARLTHD
ncbi:DUF1499 domain-containing protein [Defluviimonas sp. SAOS-178_SWC]|uniref:DUF1499 domain-containing protein n=1 Tax=Defluviimonas sp. SAOS-178_SWC TaxID=3121287 RepID=UPI0032214979